VENKGVRTVETIPIGVAVGVLLGVMAFVVVWSLGHRA
jgi:hypothetical protein